MIYLSGDYILAFHQRMSGKILVTDPGFTDSHVRYRYHLSSGKDLIFHDVRKFGIKWYGPEKKILRDKYFSKLGLDPLEINFMKFEKHLRMHRGMVKALLLRQDVLAGVGNIIADESLWKARIHPREKIENFSKEELKRLYDAIRFILKKSIMLGGSTMRNWLHPDSTTGGYFKKRLIYQRKGKKCRRCGTIITRVKVAGRGTFICTTCQKLK